MISTIILLISAINDLVLVSVVVIRTAPLNSRRGRWDPALEPRAS